MHPPLPLPSPLVIAALCLLPLAGGAQDKAKYHLFNPTPDAEMRELTTDRPDKTESPITVDAGHFQIEADLINETTDRHSGDRSDAYDFATMNFKVGLTNWMDLQAVVQAYHYERTRSAGHRDTDSGFGDVTLRTKINFWGNDGGTTALGIMPFVTLPTARGSFGATKAEWGIIIPLGIDLGGGWGMGLMTEVDFVSEEDGGHTTHWVNSITVSRDLTETIGMYGEFFSDVPMDDSSAWAGSFDVGFTCLLSKNFQVDLGVNIGVTDTADDVNPFLGLTYRF